MVTHDTRVRWICAKNTTEWATYRLGDMVTQRSWREAASGETHHFTRYPNSIASEYMRRTSHENATTILADIVRRRNTEQHHDVPIDWAVHIRGGDVMEDDILASGRAFEASGKMKGRSRAELRVTCSQYIRPVKDIMSDFVPSQTDDHLTVCIFTGGTHVSTAPKTSKYVEHIAMNFLKHPKVDTVLVRFFNSPDDDFELMCRAPNFIASGGGFSELITRVRDQPGVCYSKRRVLSCKRRPL